MTVATAEFRQELQEKLADNVLLWTEQLCDNLEKNYFNYHKRMITNNSQRYTEGELSEYAQSQLESINNGTAKLMKFRIETGRKYHKIIQQDYDTFQDRNEYRDGSVHAFVDKNTGAVYKPASYNSPHTKHIRYNLLDEDSRAECLLRADWAGGYLYLR